MYNKQLLHTYSTKMWETLKYISIYFPVVNENVSLVISRQILTDVSTQLALIPHATSKTISHFILDKVRNTYSFHFISANNDFYITFFLLGIDFWGSISFFLSSAEWKEYK